MVDSQIMQSLLVGGDEDKEQEKFGPIIATPGGSGTTKKRESKPVTSAPEQEEKFGDIKAEPVKKYEFLDKPAATNVERWTKGIDFSRLTVEEIFNIAGLGDVSSKGAFNYSKSILTPILEELKAAVTESEDAVKQKRPLTEEKVEKLNTLIKKYVFGSLALGQSPQNINLLRADEKSKLSRVANEIKNRWKQISGTENLNRNIEAGKSTRYRDALAYFRIPVPTQEELDNNLGLKNTGTDPEAAADVKLNEALKRFGSKNTAESLKTGVGYVPETIFEGNRIHMSEFSSGSQPPTQVQIREVNVKSDAFRQVFTNLVQSKLTDTKARQEAERLFDQLIAPPTEDNPATPETRAQIKKDLFNLLPESDRANSSPDQYFAEFDKLLKETADGKQTMLKYVPALPAVITVDEGDSTVYGTAFQKRIISKHLKEVGFGDLSDKLAEELVNTEAIKDFRYRTGDFVYESLEEVDGIMNAPDGSQRFTVDDTSSLVYYLKRLKSIAPKATPQQLVSKLPSFIQSITFKDTVARRYNESLQEFIRKRLSGEGISWSDFWSYLWSSATTFVSSTGPEEEGKRLVEYLEKNKDLFPKGEGKGEDADNIILAIKAKLGLVSTEDDGTRVDGVFLFPSSREIAEQSLILVNNNKQVAESNLAGVASQTFYSAGFFSSGEGVIYDARGNKYIKEGDNWVQTEKGKLDSIPSILELADNQGPNAAFMASMWILDKATQMNVLVLNFATDATTATTYWQLLTEDEIQVLDGNYTMTEAEFNAWGVDNNVVNEYVANAIGVNIIK